MKKVILIIVILILAGLAVWLFYKPKSAAIISIQNNQQQVTTSTSMQITSAAFLVGQNIPVKYSCDGQGVNPPLEFSNVPAQAASLALIVHDPDAPNGNWVHWLMWNILPSVNNIPENSVPQGATQGQASSGQNIYSGPCPPNGIHRYIFTLYALDQKLTIPSYSTDADLIKAMNGHILAQAELLGMYARGK